MREETKPNILKNLQPTAAIKLPRFPVWASCLAYWRPARVCESLLRRVHGNFVSSARSMS